MNLSSILETAFSGITLSITCYIIWFKIFSKKISLKKHSICTILITMLSFYNYYFNNNYIKVVGVILMFTVVIRLFYINDLKSAVVASLVTELTFIMSELFFSVIMLLCFHDNLNFVMEKYFGTLLINSLICIIAIIICRFMNLDKFYKTIRNMIEKINISMVLLIFSILTISVNIFLMLPYYQVSTVTVVLLNFCMIVVYSLIVFKFIQAKNRYIEINDKYSLTETSLKELQSNINRLMTVNHEHKNQLLTIRTMVANKDKDVLKNIDTIIDRKIKDDKELKVRTSIISNTMLGALVYSKLLTMKENNINYNIHIDKALSKSNFIKLDDKTNVDICKAVGVYLDNAIEAVNGIDVKEINIDLFLEDNYLYITIANTFDGNIDVNMLDDYGYTTKSEGHGYGLALVKEVIKENNNLDSETEIIDNVFIQKLKIKM